MTPELAVDGPAAPPRVNGELSFQFPWQRRLFATTMALCDAGRLDFASFRDRLISEIADNDRRAHAADKDRDSHCDYWSAWQNALEAMVAANGLVDSGELKVRARRFAEHHR